MKHFFLLGLVLAAMLPYQAFSQKNGSGASQPPAIVAPGGGGTLPSYCAEPISGLQAHIDSIYAPLDKTLVPYGVLYNRANQQADLLRFNALAPDTSNVMYFRQALYELHTTAYTTSQLPCQADVRDYARQSSDRDTALIGMLHYGFGYLDSTALANNLVYYDTNVPALLHDVPGRSRSPYLSREVTMMAALLDTSRFGVLRFRLDTRLCYTNTGRVLSSVSVDFADGNGPQSLLPNQTRTVTYLSTGEKVLRYTMYFTDGSQRVTRSSLYVSNVETFSKDKGPIYAKNKRPPVTSCFSLSPRLTADIGYSRNGRLAMGDVDYYYSTEPGSTKFCNRTGTQYNVTKPIIVIDGFDHDDERKAGNIYADKLVYTVSNGTAQNEYNLADELRGQGYDLVILNFPRVITGYTNVGFFLKPNYYRGGSTYIEANAFVLVKLIQQLNDQLTAAGSTEKLVIIGPSMGGQIAKYALAYMETHGMTHNTRLYVSLDSPHNGANMPIGDQLFLKYFASDIGIAAAQDGLNEVNSPASKELTLQHYSQLPVGTGALIPRQGNTVPFQADPERGRYLTNLTNVGSWPQQLRRVAVTNGSLTAQRQTKTSGPGAIADGDQAFYFEAALGAASARVYFSFGYGNGVGHLVMEGHYPIGRGRNYYAVAPNGSCGFDAMPGGWFGVNDEIAQKVTDGQDITRKTIYSLQKNSCFIPMHSALAYQPAGGGPDDYCQPLGGTDLVCDGTIPFDAYYGPRGYNEEHIQLTVDNVNFIRNEITRVTAKPTFLLTPAYICASGAGAVFSIKEECTLPNRPQPAITYTWTVDNGATFANGTTSSTGPVQTLHGDAGFDGEAFVTVVATRAGYAPSAPRVVGVRIASYSDLASYYLPANGGISNYRVCRNESLQFGVDITSYDPTSIRWFAGYPGSEVQLVNTPQNTYDGQSRVSLRINGPTNTNWNVYSVFPMATDLCDGVFKRAVPPDSYSGNSGSPSSIVISIINPPYCFVNRPAVADEKASRGALTTFPNPANGTLTVRLDALAATGAAPQSPVEVRLYNGQGQLVCQRQTAGLQFDLPTAALPAGLYHVVVTSEGHTLRQHIEVKH